MPTISDNEYQEYCSLGTFTVLKYSEYFWRFSLIFETMKWLKYTVYTNIIHMSTAWVPFAIYSKIYSQKLQQ